MLVGKRRLGKALLERHIVYDLSEDGQPIGFIEYSADRDRIEIRGRSYSIVSERKPLTLLEQVAKLLTWRWKNVFAFRDDARRLIATAEKSALNVFSLHNDGAVFSIWPRSRGCLEVRRQRDGVVVGEVEYREWSPPKWCRRCRSNGRLHCRPSSYGCSCSTSSTNAVRKTAARAPRENWWAVAGCPFHVKRWLEIPTPFGDFERDGFSSKGHPTRSFVRARSPGKRLRVGLEGNRRPPFWIMCKALAPLKDGVTNSSMRRAISWTTLGLLLDLVPPRTTVSRSESRPPSPNGQDHLSKWRKHPNRPALQCSLPTKSRHWR